MSTASGDSTTDRLIGPRIALLGPYASRNLGDTATQMTVIRELRRRIPRARFVGVSPEPGDTWASLGIPAFPLSGFGPTAGELGVEDHACDDPGRSRPLSLRAARRISRFVRSLDLLVVSGGGQLDDFWGGPWGHPWSMLLWTLLARRHRIPVAYLAVGIDKLDSPMSKRFCVWGLNRASWRSFRDPLSRQKMVDLGLAGPATVCPDVVFALDPGVERRSTGTQAFVVISPISRKTWSHEESAAQSRYMDALAECGIRFSRLGLAIRILCSQTVMDTDEARNLERSLRARGATNVTLCEAPVVEGFLQCVYGAELVIASRLHAVILSLVAGAPVVAVAHLAKVEAAMQAAGLSELCLSLHDVQAEQLCSVASRAFQARKELAAQVEHANRRSAEELSKTFDALASLVAP